MSSLPNTHHSAFRSFISLFKRRLFLGRLGNRLVVQILVISASLSFFTSSVQLYAGYQRDKNELPFIVTTVRDTISSALSEALWEYNFELVQALAQGVYNKEHVEFVYLETPQGRVWEIGAVDSTHAVEVVALFFEDPSKEPQLVGELTIGISEAVAIKRLWDQIWVVLLTNFLKAAIASAAISILFERNVGQHLRKVAEHVSRTDWQDGPERIKLDRSSDAHDDIGRVVHAIHSAKQRSHANLNLLSEEVALRTKAQDRLNLRTIELENANREQAEFTYALSHDMKSPTNTMRLLIDDLRDVGADRFDQDCIDILDDMELTGSRMSILIEDVLNYASTIGAKVDRASIDLNALFKEISDDLRGDIRKQKAKVTAGDLPCIRGSRMQFRLLLQNLISNGLKFRPPDRPPEIHLDATVTEQRVVLKVTDNGIGIPEEYFERIFGMFKRLHAQDTYEGTGLGLPLCRRIVLNHGGKISVSSVVGEGTCFTMEFDRDVG